MNPMTLANDAYLSLCVTMANQVTGLLDKRRYIFVSLEDLA